MSEQVSSNQELSGTFDDYEKYHNILKNMITTMITNDLTIGRQDNDLMPFTIDEINNFIFKNDENIENVIKEIINVYEQDGDIDELNNPLYDWIGEFLYEVIKY